MNTAMVIPLVRDDHRYILVVSRIEILFIIKLYISYLYLF